MWSYEEAAKFSGMKGTLIRTGQWGIGEQRKEGPVFTGELIELLLLLITLM